MHQGGGQQACRQQIDLLNQAGGSGIASGCLPSHQLLAASFKACVMTAAIARRPKLLIAADEPRVLDVTIQAQPVAGASATAAAEHGAGVHDLALVVQAPAHKIIVTKQSWWKRRRPCAASSIYQVSSCVEFAQDKERWRRYQK